MDKLRIETRTSVEGLPIQSIFINGHEITGVTDYRIESRSGVLSKVYLTLAVFPQDIKIVNTEENNQ